MNMAERPHSSILIVDDDPPVSEVVATQCTMVGLLVQRAPMAWGASRCAPESAEIADHGAAVAPPRWMSLCERLLGQDAQRVDAIVISGYFDFEDYERCGSLGAMPVEKGNGFWQQWREALVDLLPADERENNLSARELGRVSTNPLNTADFDLDSDPRPYQFLKSRLKKFGIEVLTAADAAQGLRVGRSDMPSMILAAHLLPDGNAEHLLWKLRSRPRTRQLPFFITADRLSKHSQKRPRCKRQS